MVDWTKIREHMEIVAADGVHVGKVDCLKDECIVLISHDDEHGIPMDHHRYLPLAQVQYLDADRVWLSARATEVRILLQARRLEGAAELDGEDA